MKSKNFAVVGCGMAGLAVAIMLRKQGHWVSVFEKFAEAKPVGAGILLQPSGLQALQHIGIRQSLEQSCAKVEALIGDDVNAGRLMDVPYAKLDEAYYGLGVHRGNLFMQLYREAEKLDIPINCNTHITAIEEPLYGCELITSEGKRIPGFNAAIIANGTQSALRDSLTVKQSFKEYPWGALWAILPDPDQRYARYLTQRYADAKVMIGMLPTGIDPLTGEHCVSFFWSLPVNEYSKWKASDFSQWKQQVLAIWPEIASTLDHLQHPDQLSFARYGSVSMQRCYQRRVICIGDAAHGMSPQLGQGTNLALIDAVVLARCIAEHNDFRTAYRVYQQRRQAHIRFYHYASQLLTPFFQSNSWLASKVRNIAFPVFNKVPFTFKQSIKTVSGIKTGLMFDKDIFE